MVNELGLVTPGATGTAEAAPTRTFIAQAPVAMRSGASAGSKVVRTLPIGANVYPTGGKNGLWWEVADENDNVGWVLNPSLRPRTSDRAETRGAKRSLSRKSAAAPLARLSRARPIEKSKFVGQATIGTLIRTCARAAIDREHM